MLTAQGENADVVSQASGITPCIFYLCVTWFTHSVCLLHITRTRVSPPSTIVCYRDKARMRQMTSEKRQYVIIGYGLLLNRYRIVLVCITMHRRKDSFRHPYWTLGLGIIWILSIPIPILILLMDSESYRFPVSIPMWLKKLSQTFRYQTYLFCVSFCKTFNFCWTPWTKISWLHKNWINNCLCAK